MTEWLRDPGYPLIPTVRAPNAQVVQHPTDRPQGTLLVGGQSAGKTSVLLRSFHNDCHDPDAAVILIDPKSEIARLALALVPPACGKTVWYLNLAYPRFGMSPLWLPSEVMRDPRALAASVAGIADNVVNSLLDVNEGQLFQASRDLLYHATIGALAIAAAQDTRPRFEVIYGLLLPYRADLRDAVVSATSHIPDLDQTREYWAREIPDQLAGAASMTRQQMKAPRNKIGGIVGVPPLRRFFNHPVDMPLSRIVERRDVLIVDANMGAIGPENAIACMQFLLRMLHTRMQQQIHLDCADRPRVALHVDEAHYIANENTIDMLATHRAAGLDVTLAHQFLAQLMSSQSQAKSEKIRKGILNLCQSRFLFRLGDPEDAQEASRIAMAVYESMLRSDPDARARMRATPEMLLNMPRWHCLASWIINGQRAPSFIAQTYPMPRGLGWSRWHYQKLVDACGEYPAELQSTYKRVIDDVSPIPAATDNADTAEPPPTAGQARHQPGRDGQHHPGDGQTSSSQPNVAADHAAAVHERQHQLGVQPGPELHQPAGEPHSTDSDVNLAKDADAAADATAATGDPGRGPTDGPAPAAPRRRPSAGAGAGGQASGSSVDALVPEVWQAQTSVDGGGPLESRVLRLVGRTLAERDYPPPEPGQPTPSTYAELAIFDRISDIASPQDAPPLQPIQRYADSHLRVLKLLDRLEYLTTEQLRRAVWPAAGERAAQKSLARLQAAGLIQRVPTRLKGASRRNSPPLWTLTAKGFAVGQRPPAGRAPVISDRRRFRVSRATEGARLAHNLHVVNWLQALHDLAPGLVTDNWRTPRYHTGRFTPPVTGQGRDRRTIQASDIWLGDGIGLAGMPMSGYDELVPDLAVELHVISDPAPRPGRRFELRFDLLVELDLTQRPAYNIDKFKKYDAFLTGWCLAHPRIQQLRTRPVVVFVSPNPRAALALLKEADATMTASVGRIGKPEHEWYFAGRDHTLFAVEGDLHHGSLRALKLPPLPKVLRERLGDETSTATQVAILPASLVRAARPKPRRPPPD